MPRIQASLLRILYCWSIRRPALGTFKGSTTLTPFTVFSLYSSLSLRTWVTRSCSPVEADVFWCFSNLLDTIQDSYTFNQSGIYRQVSLFARNFFAMDLNSSRISNRRRPIHSIRFSLDELSPLREFRLPTIQRLWDAYLSEGPDGFKSLHPYICAAFLFEMAAGTAVARISGYNCVPAETAHRQLDR